MNKLYRVETYNAVFGFTVNKKNIVVNSAPIIRRWAIGEYCENVISHIENKWNGEVTLL